MWMQDVTRGLKWEGNEVSRGTRSVTMDNLKGTLTYGSIDRIVICKLNKG